MFVRFAIVSALFTLLAGMDDVNADILLNSGFESGTNGDAAEWEEIVGGAAGSVTRSSAAPRTGSFSAHMSFDHINNTETAGAYFFQQNLGANTINNSLAYNLSFWARSESNDFEGADMFVQIQWLDQDGSDGGGFKGETLISLVGQGLNTDYQRFILNDLNPSDGSDSFLLRFQVSAGAVAGTANGMFVDDASLSVVPEPTSVLVLACGALTLLCRRNRSAMGE